MIWLIGNKGMLGKEVEGLLKDHSIAHITNDIEVDITDYDAIIDFIGGRAVDWIINCSAYTAVDRAEDEPELAFRINAEGVLNIAKLARHKNAKLIHISTDYVFDGEKEGCYTERDVPNPPGVYGKSKLAGEENIRRTWPKNFIVRTAWLYGRHGQNFVYTMLRLFGEKDVVKVVSDQHGNPTFTKDLASVIVNISRRDSEAYGIYHFTNEGYTTWYDFALRIQELAIEYGILERKCKLVPINTSEYPCRAKRPLNSCLSKEKIKAVFGFKIREWKEALNEFVKEISGLNRLDEKIN